MTKALSKILSIGVALTFATALFVTANARSSSAHPAQAALQTLKLDYFAAAKGKLASTLDPGLVTSATAADTIAMTNANLVHIGTDNKVHLDLASKYTVSKNHKVYTFTIRSNARYSNGHYVTASDIKESIKEADAPSTASPVATSYMGAIVGVNDYNAGKATDISGLKVLGKRVIQITIDKPYAYFLKTLTYPTSDALDQTVVAGKVRAAANNFLTHTCPGNQGAGPFKFVCSGNDFFPTGQTPSYSMVPNPFYYGKKPTIKVELPAIDTTDTSYKVYQSGGIDTTSIPSGNVAQWKGNKQLISWGTSIVSYLTPNTHMAPMNDRNCRLAVAYGIDRSKIAHSILHDLVHIIYDVVPPGFLGYYNGKDNPHFSLSKAKAALAKCATKDTPLKITYPTGSSDADNTYNEVGAELKAVGFNVSVNAITANDWYNVVGQSLDKTNTQLVRNGWQQDYPDPQDYVTLLLRCGLDYDIGGYCNTKFDGIVDKADLESNTKKRAAEYIQAQHIAISDGAWLTLWNGVGYQLIKPYVKGLVGTVSYGDLVPVGYDWSRVTVGKH